MDEVLRSACIVCEEGVHLEFIYSVVPGYNDFEDEVSVFCLWVRNTLGSDVPVHFTRFRPDNQMTDVGFTLVETVMRCRRIGIETGLKYLYAENILDEEAYSTYCLRCGRAVIRRLGYCMDMEEFNSDRCAFCGARLSIICRGGGGGPSPTTISSPPSSGSRT